MSRIEATTDHLNQKLLEIERKRLADPTPTVERTHKWFINARFGHSQTIAWEPYRVCEPPKK
jgi:hypothetical protein